MSHAVVRGKPCESQLYLDTVIGNIMKENCYKTVDDVNLSEIVFYSMKKNLKGLYMINGATGEKVTNEQILKLSVLLARAISNKGLTNKRALFLTSNHKQMAALYYSVMLSGVIPLFMDPNSTIYEIGHFYSIISPEIIFCDEKRYDDVISVAQGTLVIADDDASLNKFCDGYSNDINSFRVRNTSIDSAVILLPTSGSSGLPKATVLTHQGLIAQIPALWTFHETFPRPTELAMLLSTAQWMTHTCLMTSCPVYEITILMTSQQPNTPEHVVNIVENFQPTWALLGPAFAKNLAVVATPGQLKSLKTVVTTGAPLSQSIRAGLEEKLSKSADLYNGIGMTEVHGFFALPDRSTHLDSNGKIFNILNYKIVDEDGFDSGSKNKGELWLKSDRCIFKDYLGNKEAYIESLSTDGWLKTGDIFYEDENDDIFFVERKKFWFKYMNYQISPEEVEYVIGSVPGVKECVVCGTENGPAAAVVLQKGAGQIVTKELILSVVRSRLSDYKQLRGGLVLVDTLPCTYSGKIKRMECNKMIIDLIDKESPVVSNEN